VILPGAQMLSDVAADHAQQADSVLSAAASAQTLTGVSLDTDGDFVQSTTPTTPLGLSGGMSVGSSDEVATVDGDSSTPSVPAPVTMTPITLTNAGTELTLLTPIATDVSSASTSTAIQGRLDLYAGINRVAGDVAS